MVKFVTLYLGLFVGSHTVELMVDNRVATVELLLDGEAVARLEEAPWVTSIDFGTELESGELVAIAYDSRGDELHRTAQAINRPRPRAEAQLLIDHNANGQAVSARVSWQSSEDERPTEVLVTLDGEPLVQLEPYTYGLPSLSPNEFHILQADVRFEAGGHAHATVALGGEYHVDTGDQLTAVLVSLKGKKRRYDLAELGGWFLFEGIPQSVVAAERGPVEVLFVRAAERVATATEALPGQPSTPDSPVRGWSSRWTAEEAPWVIGGHLRTALSLPRQYRLRLLDPYATRADRGRMSFETFPCSPDLRERGGVLWALEQRFPLAHDQPRVTDAVAVAGLEAAMGNRRRAVVLVTVDDVRDFSTLRPAVVIHYLRRLQVPLFVWHLGAGPAPSGWPEANVITTFKALRHAVRNLEKELSRQRVIWLDGTNDPESIRLARSAAADIAGPPL